MKCRARQKCSHEITIIELANLKRKYHLEQDSNPDLQVYALALYQLNHLDKLLGQVRILFRIPFPLYLLEPVHYCHLSLKSNTFLVLLFLNFGIFNVRKHRGKFNVKILFSNWPFVGHKCVVWVVQLVERQRVELESRDRILVQARIVSL